MTGFRSLKAAAVLTIVAIVAFACGGGGGASPAPSGSGASPSGAAGGEIIIASDFPTSGSDAASGLPAQNGADFAVRTHSTVKGFKITFLPFDDAVNGVHDPQKGAQNVQQMLANNKVLAMVGPFNSNVARAEIPVANRGPLAMISPANTNECLTQTFDYCDPKPAALRPTGKNNYFRIAAPDTVQGPAMADLAYDTLNIKKIAIWSDNETFGKGVADNFQKEFTKKGGTVVKRQDFDWKTTNDFKAFLTQAKDGGAQGIYAGATSATKGCIPRAQGKGIIDPSQVAYMGPDGIGDTQCISDAGDQAVNMYFTNAAADASQDPANQAVIADFKKTFTKDGDLGAYTFPSYDCAMILIDAIGRAIDAAGGKMPTREQVITALQATSNLKLTTGSYSFDQNGDPTHATMAFYKLNNKKWDFLKQFGVGQ